MHVSALGTKQRYVEPPFGADPSRFVSYPTNARCRRSARGDGRSGHSADTGDPNLSGDALLPVFNDGDTSIPQPLVAPRLSIVVLPFVNLSNASSILEDSGPVFTNRRCTCICNKGHRHSITDASRVQRRRSGEAECAGGS
jgi:hypothetical protein